MYLIIDDEYRIFQSRIMSGCVHSQVKKGNLSIVELVRMEGMNIDGTWSPIQEYNSNWDLTSPSFMLPLFLNRPAHPDRGIS